MPGALLPAYLIVGEDELKRQTAVKRLKARLDGGLEAFNLDERTASPDLDPADVAVSLNTMPFGQGFRLVIIHEANKLSKAVGDTLIAYLDNPNPGCVLCLVAEKLAKNTRLYKAVAKVGARSVIDCTPLKARDLPAYVTKHARALGMTIDMAAAQELISRSGESTTLLDRQLKTLAELCGNTIALADVQAHVARTAEVKPWEFLDKITAGDAQRALELYRHMQSPSHLALLSLLVRRVRELCCARALIDRGQPGAIPSALGRQEWQVRNVIQDARRYTQPQLAACLEACKTCEREIKGGRDEEAAFLRCVLFLSNPA